MIKISVDEAYAWDMLAVLHIKSELSSDEKNLTNFLEFLDNMTSELGIGLCNTILASEEYKCLKHANHTVFNLIELICKERGGLVYTDALTVHDANMQRFTAKKALQQKFFNTNLTEQKTIL